MSLTESEMNSPVYWSPALYPIVAICSTFGKLDINRDRQLFLIYVLVLLSVFSDLSKKNCSIFGKLDTCSIFGELNICSIFGKLDICSIFGKLDICSIFGKLDINGDGELDEAEFIGGCLDDSELVRLLNGSKVLLPFSIKSITTFFSYASSSTPPRQ